MRKVTLNKTNLSDLSALSIGKRVRYLREILQNEFGNDFSGKSVAKRINLFSQSTLTTFERDKSKDIPSKALYAISKDFGADIYMFFDDFYHLNPNSIAELIPPLYNDTKPEIIGKTSIELDNDNLQLTGTNPLLENEYLIKATVSKLASNQDEQLTFIYKSRVKYSEQHLFLLLSQIVNQINTIDASIEPILIKENRQSNAMELADDYISHSSTSLNAFPWYPNKAKVSMDNKAYQTAITYTEKLTEDFNQFKGRETKDE